MILSTSDQPESTLAQLLVNGVRQQGYMGPGSGTTSMNEVWGLYGGGLVLTTDTARTRARDVFGKYYDAVSAATIGSNIGHSFNATGGAISALEVPGTHKIAVRFDRFTNMRCFFGLSASSTLGSGIDADAMSNNGFGVQFSTDRGDTTFQIVSYNGTQTTTPTTVTPVSGRCYEFTFYWTSSTLVNVEIREYTNPATFVSYLTTITATLPPASTDLIPNFGAEPRNAATLSMRCYGLYSANFSR